MWAELERLHICKLQVVSAAWRIFVISRYLAGLLIFYQLVD